MGRKPPLAPSLMRQDPCAIHAGASENPKMSLVLVSALRGPGHLHDGGTEEVLQRHEEAGLQEAPEAHPPAPGEPSSQISNSGENLLGRDPGKPPQPTTNYHSLFTVFQCSLGPSASPGKEGDPQASDPTQRPQLHRDSKEAMKRLWQPGVTPPHRNPPASE